MAGDPEPEPTPTDSGRPGRPDPGRPGRAIASAIAGPVPPAARAAVRRRWPALSRALTLVGAAVAFWTTITSDSPILGSDIVAYWAVDPADPYVSHVAPNRGAFLYSPPLAFLFAPLGALPFEAVQVGWLAFCVAILAAIAGPLARAVWAFPVLTKVTPVVGLAWFAGRGDWRGLAIAGAATAAIADATFLAAPDLWFQWFDVLRANQPVATEFAHGPLWLRVALAAAVCWLAGRTGRPWIVPIAVTVSLPTPGSTS